MIANSSGTDGSQADFQGGLETGTGAYGFDPNY